jgi:hypothetical protein
MNIRVEKKKTKPGTYHLYVHQVEWLKKVARESEVSESEALRQILDQVIEKTQTKMGTA